MARRDDPRWRDRAARALVLDELPHIAPERALLLLEEGGEMADALASGGAEVRAWHRRLPVGGAGPGVEGRPGNDHSSGERPAVDISAWPPEGSFDWIGLRLPRAREEMLMFAHAAAARLEEGGRLWIWGAKDEGIRSAPGRLEELFGSVDTLAVGGRCRLLECRGPASSAARGRLEDWRQTAAADSGLPEGWVSWPGCFSHGRLDRGTRLLLEDLPYPDPGATVLDFACGTGPIARAVLDGGSPDDPPVVTGIDNDALSLVAFGENVPEAESVISDGFGALRDLRFDLILANPPYHRGKAGTSRVLEELCRRAADHLELGGRLRLVVQSTHALDPLLSDSFDEIEVRTEEEGFRVWDALRTS